MMLTPLQLQHETALWTPDSLAAALQLDSPPHPAAFRAHSVEVEPEACSPGSLFIAVERGNSEPEIVAAVQRAFERGAVAALSSRDLQSLGPGAPIWKLEEIPQLALRKLAKAARARFGGKVVGVTGSVGKTSTTGFIHHILGSFGLSSSRNGGNPGWSWVTVANTPPHYDYLAVEIPTDRPGMMAEKAAFARPHIAVIANIGISHHANYIDRRQILREKAGIFDHLEGEGCAVIAQSVRDFDDAHDRVIRAKKPSQLMTVGLAPPSDIFLSELSSDAVATWGTMSVCGASHRFRLANPGRHFAHNAMLAVGAARMLGLPAADAVAALASAPFPARRMQRWKVHIAAGVIELIDDSYNAAPDSVRALLRVLRDRPGASRRVLVLGDMLELGPDAEGHHRRLAPAIAEAGVDLLLVIGPLARRAAEDSDVSEVHSFDTARQAAKALLSLLRVGDLVAVKGSNAVGLDSVVDAIAPSDRREQPPLRWCVEGTTKAAPERPFGDSSQAEV